MAIEIEREIDVARSHSRQIKSTITIISQWKMNLIIRQYIERDLGKLKILMGELGYSLELNELIINIEAINKKGGSIFVAEAEAQLVGSICAIIDVRLAEGVYGEIVSLIVSEGYRGSGVGRKLVGEAEKWVSNHANKIRVRANEIRSDAHLFYKSQGYQEIKSQKVFKKLL